MEEKLSSIRSAHLRNQVNRFLIPRQKLKDLPAHYLGMITQTIDTTNLKQGFVVTPTGRNYYDNIQLSGDVGVQFMPTSDNPLLATGVKVSNYNNITSHSVSLQGETLGLSIPINRNNTPDYVRMRHDLCGSEFKGTYMPHVSDVSFDQVFDSSFNEGTIGKLSPDDLIFDEKSKLFIVVEFKTAGGNEGSVFERVKMKYESPINYFLQKDWAGLLLIVVVHPSGVFTNMNLGEIGEPNEIVQNACLAFQLGQRIMLEAKGLGWIDNLRDGEHIEVFKDVKSQLSSMQLEKEFSPYKANVSDMKLWREEYTRISNDVKSLDTKYFKEFVSGISSKIKKMNEETKADNHKKKYLSDWEGRECRDKMSKKAPVNFPCLVPKKVESAETIPNYNYKGDNEYSRIWASAVESAKAHKTDRFTDLTVEELETRASMSRATSDQSLKYEDTRRAINHRVDIFTDSDVKLLLSSVGILGKKFKYLDNPVVKEHKHQTKLPFHINGYVGDIDQFLDGDQLWMFEPSGFELKSEQRMENIANFTRSIEHEIGIGLNNDIATKFVKWFRRTKLAAWLDMIEQIFEELTLKSSLRSSWRLTKLKDYNMWLLMRPHEGRNKERKIHVSLLFKDEDFEVQGLPFIQPEKLNFGWSYVKFVSWEMEDLDHFLGLSEVIMGYLALWLSTMSINPALFMEDPNHPKFKSALSHFKFNSLMAWANKPAPSRDFKLVRYMYMTALSSTPLLSKSCETIFDKTHYPRDRLHLWIIKRYIYMTELLDKTKLELRVEHNADVENITANDVYENLPSIIDYSNIKDGGVLLEIMYMAYSISKDKMNKVHGNFAIISKLLKNEMFKRPVSEGGLNNDYLGRKIPKNVSDCKKHEYNYEFVLMCSKLLNDKIMVASGGRKEAWFNEKLMQIIKGLDWKGLATTRASGPEEYNRSYLEARILEPNMSCLEAVYDQVKDRPDIKHPFSDMKEKLMYIRRTHGGFVFSLFVKNQYGDWREIAIQTITGRVMVLLLELFAIEFGKLLANEYMSKGDAHTRAIDSFNRKIRKMVNDMKEDMMTVQITADKSTWCNQQTASIMGCFFSNIFPESYGDFFPCISNLMVNKKLRMPETVLTQFVKHPTVDSFTDELNAYKSEFSGNSKTRYMTDGDHKSYVVSDLGWPQGLMGAISSVMHSCFELKTLQYTKLYIKYMIRRLGLENKYVNDVSESFVSSDDSGRLSYIIHKLGLDAKERKALMIILTTASLTSVFFETYMGFKTNLVKTSISGLPIIEFMSAFYMMNNHRSNIGKYLKPAIKTYDTMDMNEVMNIKIGSLNSMAEAGADRVLCGIVNEAQMKVHYLCLGLNVNPLFNSFASDLMSKPHPNLGFFLLSPKCLSGIVRNDYNLHNLLMVSSPARKVQMCILKGSGTSVDPNTGSVALRIFFVNRKQSRIDKIKEYMNLGPDLISEIDSDPEFLYRKTRNTDEERKMIQVQALTMLTTFAKTNVRKVFSLGMYSYFSPSTMITEPAMRDKFSEVVSLKTVFSKIYLKEEVNDDIVRILFPMRQFYMDLNTTMKTKRNNIVRDLRRQIVKHKNSIVLPKVTSICPLLPDQVLGKKWFNLAKPGSRYEHNLSLEILKNTFIWIEDSEFATRENVKSPFKNAFALRNFLTTLRPTSVTIKTLSSARPGIPVQAYLSEDFKYSYLNGHVVLGEEFLEEVKGVVAESHLETLLLLSTSGPNYNETSSRIVRRVFETEESRFESLNINEINNIISQSSKENITLDVMHYLWRMRKDKSITNDRLRIIIDLTKKGTWVYWIESQQYDRGLYYGKGVFALIVDGSKFLITMMDKTITRIQMKRGGREMALSGIVDSVLKRELDIKGADGDTSRPARMYLDFKLSTINTNSKGTMPIEVMDSDINTDINPKDLFIEVSRGQTVQLKMHGNVLAGNMMTNNNNLNRNITVLSHSLRSRKFIPGDYGNREFIRDSANMVGLWYSMRPLPATRGGIYMEMAEHYDYSAEEALEEVLPEMEKWEQSVYRKGNPKEIEKFESAKVSTHFLKEWMKESMISRARAKGWQASSQIHNISAMSKEEVEDTGAIKDIDEVGEILLDPFDPFADLDDIDFSMADELGTAQIEEMLDVVYEFDYDELLAEGNLLDMLPPSVDPIRMISSNIMPIHPYWDELLNHIDRVNPVTSRDLLLSGYRVAKNGDSVFDLLVDLFKSENRPILSTNSRRVNQDYVRPLFSGGIGLMDVLMSERDDEDD